MVRSKIVLQQLDAKLEGSQTAPCNVVDLMFFSNKGKPQRNAKSKSLQSNYALVEWNIGNGQTLAASQCQISDGIGI